MAYYELEPWGEERADLRAGIIASTIANIGTHGRLDYKPKDFIPKFGKQQQASRRRQTVEEMQAVLMGVSRAAETVNQSKRKDPGAKRQK